MFERFRDDARLVVQHAQVEARELRHGWIGTEHLLLGLTATPGPAATALSEHGLTAAGLRQAIRNLAARNDPLDGAALATIGIDLDEVRRATEASFGEGALDQPVGCSKKRTGHIPFSPRAKKALELSLREALRLKHKHIDSGHVLLGILREGSGITQVLLRDAGVRPEALRDEVTRLIVSDAA